MSDFTGRVGLVTGSGSGIGRAIASGLGRRGAAVAVLDLDEAAAHETAEAITAAGGRAIAVPVDIADEGAAVVHSDPLAPAQRRTPPRAFVVRVLHVEDRVGEVECLVEACSGDGAQFTGSPVSRNGTAGPGAVCGL